MTKKRFVTTLFLTCVSFACAFSACSTTTPPHVHSFGEWAEVTAPTCTEEGKEERTCDCGEKETRALNALGHSFGDFLKTENEHYKVCSRCDEEAERGAHVYSSENVCTTCGYTPEYTKSLAYTEVFGEDGQTVTAYMVAGYEEGAERGAEIIVPAYHNGKPVTGIAPQAFYAEKSDTTLKKVLLPDSVTEIGYNAFTHCAALSEINLDKVSVIGQSSLWDTGLTEVILKGADKTVGDYAFYACAELKTVDIECGAAIGEMSFYGNAKLEKVTLNAAISFGSKYGFGSNTALTEVEFGKNADVTIARAKYTFYGNTALNRVTVNSNSVVLGDDAFFKCTENSIDLIYGSGVTEIPEGAISGNAFVKSLTIGENVTKVGRLAFKSLTNIKSITLPEGITEVGANAFADCTAVTEVKLPKSLTKIGGGAFTLKSAEKVYYGGTVEEWCRIDFFNRLANPLLSNLQDYSDRVLYIGGKAVEGEVEINVDISPYAFVSYSHITALTLGENVTKIGQEAFEENTVLERIVIKGKNLNVSMLAFNNCTAFTSVYYNGSKQEMVENVQAGGLLPDGAPYEKVWWFENKTHYFLDETGTAEPPEQDGYNWTFGGYFHFDESGKVAL